MCFANIFASRTTNTALKKKYLSYHVRPEESESKLVLYLVRVGMPSQNWMVSIAKECLTKYFREDTLSGSIDGCYFAHQPIVVRPKFIVRTHKLDQILTAYVSQLCLQ